MATQRAAVLTDKPLTHEQRRRLIESPIGIRVVGGHTWSGSNSTQRLNDTQGFRQYHRTFTRLDQELI